MNDTLIDKIKILRSKTGISFIECKKALIDSNLDIEEAIINLRKTGLLNALKRNEKNTLEGLITSKINKYKNSAIIMEINCETDFVSKSEEFIMFCSKISNYFLNENNSTILNLKKEQICLPENLENDKINIISKFKENIVITRLQKIHSEDNTISGYVHGSNDHGKIASLITTNMSIENLKELIKDIAMQVVAMKPKYLDIHSIPKNIIELEQNIIDEYVNINYKNKTEEQIKNIKQNQIKKFYEDSVLMEQTFIKDSKVKIKDLTTNNNIKIEKFIRFEVGEENQYAK
ncbi:MAG TPA: translation elongation factor Ts [Candidatus Azoamicus sp.]